MFSLVLFVSRYFVQSDLLLFSLFLRRPPREVKQLNRNEVTMKMRHCYKATWPGTQNNRQQEILERFGLTKPEKESCYRFWAHYLYIVETPLVKVQKRILILFSSKDTSLLPSKITAGKRNFEN